MSITGCHAVSVKVAWHRALWEEVVSGVWVFVSWPQEVSRHCFSDWSAAAFGQGTVPPRGRYVIANLVFYTDHS